MIRRILTAGLILMGVSAAMAQISPPLTWGHSWGVGARALGMGGAYTAVANDYSATFYNPAGLGRIGSFEVTGSLGHLSSTTTARFMGIDNEQSSSYTKLNDIGVAIPIPTRQGSLVFSAGYHVVRDFNDYLYAEAFLPAAGDSVTQSYTFSEEGELSNVSFGAAVEAAPGLFLGGSMNIWSGEDDYTHQFRERDQPHDIWTFSDTTSVDHALTKFSGVSFTFSALYSMMDMISIGGVIVTPMTLTNKENWDYDDSIVFDDGYEEFAADEGFWSYKIRTPWIYRAGAALHFGPVLISGDIEFTDYSQMSYRTDPPEDLTQGEANFIIKDNFRSTFNYRFGGEVAIPFTGLRLRGGYAKIMSPLNQENGFEEMPLGQDRTVWSGGLGFNLMDRFAFDIGAALTSWEGINDDLIEFEKRSLVKVLATFTYRINQ